MIKRVNILVEGQTEETFVNDLLAPQLRNKNVFLKPIILTTKKVKNRNSDERKLPGRRFKGGITTYSKVKIDVKNTLNDKEAILTTMIDYYGLPNDFPGMTDIPVGSAQDKVRFLEASLRKDIGSPRFFPFLSLHEFEALLFSGTPEIASMFPEQQNIAPHLQSIKTSFATPEEINNGKDTHPAARITSLIPSYRKRFHGPIIAQRIGLNKIRHDCPHFSDWLSWLESLGG